MHDIWNPWHGCVKCSEGCQNCYSFSWTVCGTGMGRKSTGPGRGLIILSKGIAAAAIKSRAAS